MRKKTALITGSTSGIGLGIAKAFAEKGYNIVFNGLEKNGPEIVNNSFYEHYVRYYQSKKHPYLSHSH